MLPVFALSGFLMCACGGGDHSSRPGPSAAAAPVIYAAPAQNGAQIISIADTTAGATIYYTLDKSTPTTSSQIYEAPILLASSTTVSAIAAASGFSSSAPASKAFTVNIPNGTEVWSDDFNTPGQPNSAWWTYDTGSSGFGNNEQETYCAWASNNSHCSGSRPNAFAGADGYLHIVARKAGAGVYTSARLKSQGLFSFMY